MAGSNLFIQWDTHHATFMHVLSQMRIKEQFCDATILCEEHFYKVHRFVLATCSSYFEQLFSKLEYKHPVIVLTDIKAVHLEALLTFMYNGELKLLKENLPYVLQAANSLKIRGLSEECDDEAGMEINQEVMTPCVLESTQSSSITISGQLERERNRIMDFDSKPKAVQQKRQTSSPKTLMSSSTREEIFEITEIPVYSNVLVPSDYSIMNEAESDIVSADGSENHEALMLWNEGFDFPDEKNRDQAQNFNISYAASPTVESIMEEIEVKNETLDLTPEAHCMFNSNCFETARLSIANQDDLSRTTQDNAPSTAITMSSTRVSLTDGVIENSNASMYYPVELFNANSNTPENFLEFNNTVDSINENCSESRNQSHSPDVTDKNSRVDRVLRTNIVPAESHNGLRQNRIKNTLPCTSYTDDPVPLKRNRGRPRRVKSLYCSENQSSVKSSGTILEMQDKNLRIKVRQSANGEPVKGSHDSPTVFTAVSSSRKKKRGARPILKGYHPYKKKGKVSVETNTQRKITRKL